jgi:hypothetical protein
MASDEYFAGDRSVARERFRKLASEAALQLDASKLNGLSVCLAAHLDVRVDKNKGSRCFSDGVSAELDEERSRRDEEKTAWLREIGARGGRAAMASLTASQRRKRAQKAAGVRWAGGRG